MRTVVSLIYESMEEAKKIMKEEMKNEKTVFGKEVLPETYVQAKDYITELIRLDIFRKEDLYDKVFKSTTYFGDYNKQYRKYKVFEDKIIHEKLKFERRGKSAN